MNATDELSATAQSATALSERALLRVHVNGLFLSVEDSVICKIGDILGEEIAVNPDDAYGLTAQKVRKSLLKPRQRAINGGRDLAVRAPNAGLRPALVELAARKGFAIEFVRSTQVNSLPEPQLMSLGYPTMAKFVHQTPLGRIMRHLDVDDADILADLARAFPHTKIVALDPKCEPLKVACRKLRKAKISCDWTSGDRPLNRTVDGDVEQPQVLLSTPTEVSSIDFEQTDIVVVLDARTAGHERMQMALSQMDARFRLYGLDLLELPQNASLRDTQFSVFGPEVLNIYEGNLATRNLQVAFLRVEGPQLKDSLDVADVFWKCIWGNERRNRRIANVAKAMRDGNPALLKKGQDQSLRTHLKQHSGRPMNVVVLVERPLHAEALSEKLDDWPVDIDQKSLFRLNQRFWKRVQNLAGRHDRRGRIVLTDFEGLSKSTHDPDVVIWAGGGRLGSPIPEAWATAPAGSERPLLIVDFLDDFHPEAQKMRKSRRADYFANEIYPVGTDAAYGRTLKFLAQRPRGARR